MNRKTQFIIAGISFLLLAVLLLPTVIQTIHSFDNHHHNEPCKEITTHLHEETIDCTVCDYYFLNYTYTFKIFTIINLNGYKSQIVDNYSSFAYFSSVSNQKQRGPPAC